MIIDPNQFQEGLKSQVRIDGKATKLRSMVPLRMSREYWPNQDGGNFCKAHEEIPVVTVEVEAQDGDIQRD